MMVRVGGCALSLLLILYTVGCSGQYCPASDRLIVYDVAFDNCSVTINWKSPVECSSPVLRYVVKYAKDCPDNNGWKNVTLDRNKTSVVLHDEQFVMACFIGKCYFQVIAEVLNCHSTPFQIFSSCVRISESYHESMPLYNGMLIRISVQLYNLAYYIASLKLLQLLVAKLL